MRRFLALLLCLSLSVFTVARAMKPAQVFAPESDANASVDGPITEEEPASADDDTTPGASNDEGDEVNDNDGDDAAGDEATGPDDGADDDGDDSGSGDQGG
jgi:hypothetical protein